MIIVIDIFSSGTRTNKQTNKQADKQTSNGFILTEIADDVGEKGAHRITLSITMQAPNNRRTCQASNDHLQ